MENKTVSIIGKKVLHDSLGEGIIVERIRHKMQNMDSIIVEFSDGQKGEFLFPIAFEKNLNAKEEELKKIVLRELKVYHNGQDAEKSKDGLLEKISKNPVIAVTGWAATMVALAIAIIALIVQTDRKVLNYDYVTNVLVTNKLSEVEGLDIIYNKQPINQLSVTSFTLSNAGNVTIEGNDVYKGHELTIVPVEDTTEVLYAKVITQSRDIIDCNLEIKDSTVVASFQTLEKSDYVDVNVYHTGDSDSTFIMKGVIKEGKIENKSKETTESVITKIVLICSIIIILIAAFAVQTHNDRIITYLSTFIGLLALLYSLFIPMLH